MDMNTLHNDTKEFDIWKFEGTSKMVDHWFPMSSPHLTIALVTTYLLLVLKIGPEYMKKRPPFELNKIILLYNFIQILYSMFLVYISLSIILSHGVLNTKCKDENMKITVAVATYYYLAGKYSELLETVFFVLRKKNNQISFLHVYHHSITVCCSWYILKYDPSYTLLFAGSLNSFVHVVMYSYYFFSTFPNLAPYLWWKKYITKLQLAQFLLILVQMLADLLFTNCPPTNFVSGLVLFNAVLFYFLFRKFYKNAYSKKKNAQINGAKNNVAKRNDDNNNTESNVQKVN